MAVRSATVRALGAALLLVAVGAGCSSGSSSSATTAAPKLAPPVSVTKGAAASGHLVVLIEENHSLDQIVGQPEVPTLDRLAKQGTQLSQYFAITHPSLPNYIALTSGGTQGITSDCGKCDVSVDNLGAQLQKAGVSWRVYAQGLPGACSQSATDGAYAKKHVPFLYYRSVIDDPAVCANVVPFSRFAPDAAGGRLPSVAFVIPDLAHDMHGVGAGENDDDKQIERRADAFAGEVHRTLQSSPAWQQDTRLVITWDEGGGHQSGATSCCGGLAVGGHIPTFVVGPKVAAGTDSTTYSHYSLLKSIEQRYGLPLLGHAGDPATKAIPSVTG